MHQRPRCVEQWSYNVSYIHQGMLPCAWIHTVDSDLLCGVWAQCIQDIIRSWFLHLKLKQTPLFGWQRFHNTKFEIHFALMVRKNWNEVMSITSNIKLPMTMFYSILYIFYLFLRCYGTLHKRSRRLGSSIETKRGEFGLCSNVCCGSRRATKDCPYSIIYETILWVELISQGCLNIIWLSC